MEESWRRKWKVVRKWNVIVWKAILFLFSVSWHQSTLLQTHWASVSLKSCPVWFVFTYVLTACVFVTRDTVRHPRRFVFRKFVRKPNCSWSEAFVNRDLTVLENIKLCLTYSQFHVSTFHEKAVELLSASAASELLGLGIQFLHKIQRQASFFLALHLVQTETA